MKAFSIDDIAYGWLTAQFEGHALTCSNVMEADEPLALLSCLNRIFVKKAGEAWMAWAGEPDAAITRFMAEGGKITVSAWSSRAAAWDLPEAESEIAGCRDELLWEVTLPGAKLLDAVISTFALYENGNGLALYRAHWGDFPQAEFDTLKRFAIGLSDYLEARNDMAGLYCASFLKAQ